MLLEKPPVEKLDPRVRRTRQLILQAFLSLLDEVGFQAITVRAVTDRAGVNRATFYAHYSSKFALLQAAIRQDFRQELEKRTLSACHYSPENLRALIESACVFLQQMRRECNWHGVEFDSLVAREVRLQMQELLGYWLHDASPLVPVALAWALFGLAQEWTQQSAETSLAEWVAQTYALTSALLPSTHR